MEDAILPPLSQGSGLEPTSKVEPYVVQGLSRFEIRAIADLPLAGYFVLSPLGLNYFFLASTQ